MMMNPNKLLRVLGYNNLSLILIQERRHWLMKTSANNQIQDKYTGDIYQGRVDNTGSDITIESKKLPYKYDYTNEIKFNLQHAEDILDIYISALPFSETVNGLMYTRITSTKFEYGVDSQDNPLYGNYKIKFENAEECIIPFAAARTSNEVYAGKWIKTTTPPKILVNNDTTHSYDISRVLGFVNDITNPVWYYPLEESLQPFEVTKDGTTYTLAAVDDDRYIGDPLFWFTCDQSFVGSNVTFDSSNIGSNNTQIIYIANEGNASVFKAKMYVGIDGSDDATPDGTQVGNYSIIVTPKTGYTFSNIDGDIHTPLSNEITFKNTTTSDTYTITIGCTENDTISMCNDSGLWTYVDETTYSINMGYFVINNLENGNGSPLVAFLDVSFDESIPFVNETKEYGYAGIRFYAGSPGSDTVERYPYNLNKWSGLPDWLTNHQLGSDPVQEHGIVYAMHNTKTSDPENPETVQGSGLIFDPGLASDPSNPDTTDSIGRVYILSNDDTNYHNNFNPDDGIIKPARTAARICDIPTSAVQLTGAKGLSSTQVVDRKYVRTETSYTTNDKDKLYNDLTSRWVKPSHLTRSGNPAYEEMGMTNKFVFESVDELLSVDMSDHNNFRVIMNLDPKVAVEHVHVHQITNSGSNYNVNDTGLCIVGGSSFTYTVMAVDNHGSVTEIAITPDEHVTEIPLLNFDFPNNEPGQFTADYGTSREMGVGYGLRFSFVFDYEYYRSILPYKGEYYTDLFALVRERDGLYLYTFDIDLTSGSFPKAGEWNQGMKLSEFEVTSIEKSEGGIATQESFINSIIPKLETLPIARKVDNATPTSLNVMQTANHVTIIDTEHTPVVPVRESDDENELIPDNVVDMCKFYCNGIIETSAATRNTDDVIAKLTELNVLRYDSYVIWRWSTPTGLKFEFGVVSRSFNNFFTTDTTTKLPTNELNCDNYVHFNPSTTVVWTVPGIGPMIWVYDPTSTKKEEYRIDPETMDLNVVRKEMTYADIDIRMSDSSEVIKVVDDNGNYLWNIMTNNPQNIPYTPSSTDPLYQNPPMTNMNDIVIGTNVNQTPDIHKMKGNWKLVFPRISTFTLSNDITGTRYTPKKLEVIKSRDIHITDTSKVFDVDGNDVSMKTMVIEDNEEGIGMKVYNSKTSRWEEV